MAKKINKIEGKNSIQINHVYKTFKIFRDRVFSLKEFILHGNGDVQRHVVLSDIDLSISPGETVALIGTNGSGKSTLLKLMTKIIYPDKGNIVTTGKLTSLLELGSGFHPDFTGRENIYFNASIFGFTRKEIDQRIGSIIEFSELAQYIDSPVRTYSTGMYLRLAFSVAISVEADIILIDEILSVGDQHFQEKSMNKIIELIESGKTIVLVTHDMGAVKRICSRAIWLYNGSVELDGTPEEVIPKYLERCQ